MSILDRSLGHPANWVNVADAVMRMNEHYLISVETRIYFTVEVGEKPYAHIAVEAVPNIWSPYNGRDPVLKHRVWELSGRRPLSEGIYALLWEVDQTVGICWPLGRVQAK
jgi:hypothetical protein